MDYSPTGSSVHGILKPRILEWVAIYFSRGFSQHTPRGNVLLNSASRCIRCLKMALKFTSACFPQADRIYYAITLLHKSRKDPTECSSFYPDPGFSQHVLAEPLNFCCKLSAGMPLLSQGRPAEIARIDFTINRREVHLEIAWSLSSLSGL